MHTCLERASKLQAIFIAAKTKAQHIITATTKVTAITGHAGNKNGGSSRRHGAWLGADVVHVSLTINDKT